MLWVILVAYCLISFCFLSLIPADYPDYSANFANYGAEVKFEDGEEKKFRPTDMDRQREMGGGGHKNPFAQPQHHEDGEYDDPYQ